MGEVTQSWEGTGWASAALALEALLPHSPVALGKSLGFLGCRAPISTLALVLLRWSVGQWGLWGMIQSHDFGCSRSPSRGLETPSSLSYVCAPTSLAHGVSSSRLPSPCDTTTPRLPELESLNSTAGLKSVPSLASWQLDIPLADKPELPWQVRKSDTEVTPSPPTSQRDGPGLTCGLHLPGEGTECKMSPAASPCPPAGV